MENIEPKEETAMEEENDCEEDYDIEFCDDTDIDEDGDIITQKDTHSSSLFSCKIENKEVKVNGNCANSVSVASNSTKLHSFDILDIEVIYKLCSTTVLFKTETILNLIQVGKMKFH
jgi:hypothetical protein